jgi:hypothetical protein
LILEKPGGVLRVVHLGGRALSAGSRDFLWWRWLRSVYKDIQIGAVKSGESLGLSKLGVVLVEINGDGGS